MIPPQSTANRTPSGVAAPPAAPLVSICIVTHNAAEYVARCLTSIRRRTRLPYELVVVDNASRAQTRDLLARQPDLKLALNEENRLWCAGINQAMELADRRSRYLLLLNPDVEVLADAWLETLIRLVEAAPDVAVAGTTHRYSPAGPVHGWIDGCCFLVRRRALDELGRFDSERYPWSGGPAHWTVRAWKAGWRYRVAHSQDRLLLHHGHRSILDQGEAERRPEAMFRMPVRFEEMLREEGLTPHFPGATRRFLDRHWRPARNHGRFYASRPLLAATSRGLRRIQRG